LKNYKNFGKIFIGESDIAALILVGCRNNEGLVTQPLYFGEDGYYLAYILNEEAEIGSHYRLEATFNHWLKIYDDHELTYSIRADEIRIYRSGDFGCIIQFIA
jgi:hypothetical protein